MKVVKDRISIMELKKMAQEMFGNLVKAVVDVEKRIMVVGGELHSDEEAMLIEMGSKQQSLWGINLYPEIQEVQEVRPQAQDDDWIEFDSLINLRPSQGNRSRSIDDPEIRKRIIELVNNLVEK
jgi:hypothetical protein